MRKTVLCLAFFLAIALTGARGDMWTVLTPGTNVMSIARDNSGHMWCGGTFGATRLDRWGFTKDTYTSADGLAGHPVTDIAIGADGRKWFATWSAGLSCRNQEARSQQADSLPAFGIQHRETARCETRCHQDCGRIRPNRQALSL